jgi:peptide-methionine (S)-S-oxide reductase
VQAVFEHVKGVTRATSGYAGGKADTAHYERVSMGDTGHAESVQVEFNPHVVSYGELLRIYFSVAHNPTQLNYQGPDEGTQYRSQIFYTNPAQQQVAQAYIAQLGKAHAYSDPIVTQLAPLQGFYAAEDYHQDYALIHPDNPYIYMNDLPKVAHLEQLYPEDYSDKPVTVKPR